jgi:hypothetical protein
MKRLLALFSAPAHSAALALTGAAAALALTGSAMAQEAKPPAPMLIELFTSQGCSNCPKANALLGTLAKEHDVIALTYAVGYWDYLGWRDTFAKPEFTARQKSYAATLRQGGVYTPEMIVNGAGHASGSRAEKVRALMTSSTPPGAAHIAVEAGAHITITGAKQEAPADVWLVEYNPGPVMVSVKAGENAGVNMPHYNLVTKLTRLGEWRGQSEKFDATCARDCVVIVQAAQGGPILAAAKGES